MILRIAWSCFTMTAYAATAAAPGPPSTAPATTAPATAWTLDQLQMGVDPRVELLSVVFRLAGNPEYNRSRINGYTRDVDEYFLAHRGHPVIARARELRRLHGVSYDAPMSLAIHLKDVRTLALRVPLQPFPDTLDARWRQADLPAFLDLLADFVAKTRFEDFLQARQDLFDKAARQVRRTLAGQGRLEWFDAFFGRTSPIDLRFVLGMLNGGSCYGTRIVADTGQEAYCILGIWNSDNEGVPRLGHEAIPTIVHEFGHSYVNPIVDRHLALFEPAGKPLFERHAERMRRQAYGHWPTVIRESVLRACVVRYLHATVGEKAARDQVAQEAKNGFAWVGELADLLAEYERQRDRYPTFEAFVPRMTQFFDEYIGRHE